VSRKLIRDIRRAEFSQAAFEILTKHGIRGTTLEKVAAVAGVSKGVVLHHFKDKDALFEAVLRKANAVLKDGVVELFLHAENPIERLYAILVGNFSEVVFTQEVCHAWINLCAEVPHNKQSLRIQTVVHARMRSNLFSALKHIVPKSDIEKIAFNLATMVDGIWLRASLQSVQMTSKFALDEIDFALSRLIPPTAYDQPRYLEARKKMEGLSGIILNSKAFKQNSFIA
jgi:TetR/AcrR family transcriptional repressor of bet genes